MTSANELAALADRLEQTLRVMKSARSRTPSVMNIWPHDVENIHDALAVLRATSTVEQAIAEAAYIAGIHAHHALWRGLLPYGWNAETEKFGQNLANAISRSIEQEVPKRLALAPRSTAGVREALRSILIEDDSEEADDECELCAGRGTVDAYTSRTEGKGHLEGRDEIGCPACIERQHSRVVRSYIASPTNSEWNAAVEAWFYRKHPSFTGMFQVLDENNKPLALAISEIAAKRICERGYVLSADDAARAIMEADAISPLVVSSEWNAAVEACASMLASSYLDNPNTNAFCAAIRSLHRGEAQRSDGGEDQ